MEILHGSCDPLWIEAAAQALVSQSALIQSDAVLRYPAMNTGSAFISELSHAVETDAALLAGVLYRIEHGIFLCDVNHVALPVFAHLMRFRTGMEIYYSTSIGPRFRIMHGQGVVIGPRNRIGSDFTIYQGVTLGQRRQFSSEETMTIGDRCQIFAGAKVIGCLQITDDVRIGANAVLLDNALTSGTYVGIPAKKIS
ncbi:MAG: hypothetical protein ABI443_09035 [Chthoniobacterales bacterium]